MKPDFELVSAIFANDNNNIVSIRLFSMCDAELNYVCVCVFVCVKYSLSNLLYVGFF